MLGFDVPFFSKFIGAYSDLSFKDTCKITRVFKPQGVTNFIDAFLYIRKLQLCFCDINIHDDLLRRFSRYRAADSAEVTGSNIELTCIFFNGFLIGARDPDQLRESPVIDGGGVVIAKNTELLVIR